MVAKSEGRGKAELNVTASGVGQGIRALGLFSAPVVVAQQGA